MKSTTDPIEEVEEGFGRKIGGRKISSLDSSAPFFYLPFFYQTVSLDDRRARLDFSDLFEGGSGGTFGENSETLSGR